jgi:hypothetical protein
LSEILPTPLTKMGTDDDIEAYLEIFEWTID